MRQDYNPIKSLIWSIIVFLVVSTFFRFLMFIPGVRLIVSLLFLLAPILIFFLIRRRFTNFKDKFGRDYGDTYSQQNNDYQQENMRDKGTADSDARYDRQNQRNNEEIIAEVIEVKDLDEEE